MPRPDVLGCRRASCRSARDQLLQAIGTEVAAEIRSIADTNAAANRLAVSRAEEKLANIGKNPSVVSGGTNTDPPPLTIHGAHI